MKKILTVVAVMISVGAMAQKDSVAKDTVSILTLQDVNTIAAYIQAQQSGKVEVKKETWNEVLQILYSKLQIRTLPTNGQPKK